MPQATYHFPEGFIWGTATASHQVEGGNDNNDWAAWEKESGRIHKGDTAGLACDWWNGRWREDLDRAAEAGQNAHRLSIEWSRIQPAPDRWDENALDRYRAILQGMQERGLHPMVTLQHFTLPLWLAETGGWENDDSPALFEAFVRRAIPALKEYCSEWVTINEPNVDMYSSYIECVFPPGKNDLAAAYHSVLNVIRSHTRAYHAIHEIQPEAQVGMAHQYHGFMPKHKYSPLDALVVAVNHQSFNNLFPMALANGRVRFLHKSTRLPAAAGTQDFFGINYYTCEMTSFCLSPKDLFQTHSHPPGAEPSPFNFNVNYPVGLLEGLNWANRYGLPIHITENGVEDTGDDFRRKYIVSHLHQVWRALNHNIPVRSYYLWSLIDNFEWERGWDMRFGLWTFDRETQVRTPRPSAHLYEAICKQNAISHATVKEFAPGVLRDLFPG